MVDSLAIEPGVCLATPQHMLGKLGWEILQLRKALAEIRDNGWDSHAPAYHAFNCAVTAWHLVDWVWATAPDYACDDISRLLVHRPGLRGFKTALVRKHRALRICQQIANGSKHMTLENPDPTVRAQTLWEYVAPIADRMRAGEPLGRYDCHLIIWDNGVERKAIDVFEEVMRCWVDLLTGWGFIEAQLKLGDRED